MDGFRAFALEGLYLPAFFIAFGAALILAAPYRRRLDQRDVRGSWMIRYLATRNWDRRGGWMIVVFGLLTLVLRLLR